MPRLARALGALAILLVPGLAAAQVTPTQSGGIMSGRVAVWQSLGGGATPAFIGDAGSALLPSTTPITGLPIVGTGTTLCLYDAQPSNIAGGHSLCFGANSSGAGVINFGPFGNAAQIPLNLTVNGTTVALPGSGLGNVVGPNVSVAGDAAAFTTTAGTAIAGSKALIYASAFGVKCDASTDDTSALQNAINAAQKLGYPAATTGGGTLILPAGFCFVSGTLNVTTGITVIGTGTGTGSGTGNSGGTLIRATSGGFGDVIAVATDDAVTFQNFSMDFSSYQTSGAPAGGAAAISITGGSNSTANNWSKLENIRITGAYNGVRAVNAFGWVIDKSQFQDFANTGVLLTASSTFPDGTSGRTAITNSIFWDLNRGTSLASFEINGGGDIQVVGSKFLASQYGVYLALVQGPTGTLLIGQNSFEEQKTAPIQIGQLTAGKEYANITIIGNEFSSLGNMPTLAGAVSISTGTPTSALKWVRNITITGNVTNSAITTAVPFFKIADGAYGIIANNVIHNNNVVGATGISVSGSPANWTVSKNQFGQVPSGNYGAMGAANCVDDVTAGYFQITCLNTGNQFTIVEPISGDTLLLSLDGAHYFTLGTTTNSGLKLAANNNVGITIAASGALTLNTIVATTTIQVSNAVGLAVTDLTGTLQFGVDGSHNFYANTSTGSSLRLAVNNVAALTVSSSANVTVANTLTASSAIINTGITTDATHTDATVCEDTTTHQFYFGSGAAGICLGTSSLRFKEDVLPLQSGLAEVMALRPIQYRYKAGFGGGGPNPLYGFAAEQVVDVMPDLVGLDPEGRPNSIDWAGIVPVLVRAIQQQEDRIKQLEGH